MALLGGKPTTDPHPSHCSCEECYNEVQGIFAPSPGMTLDFC